jgi:hypothetical protein
VLILDSVGESPPGRIRTTAAPVPWLGSHHQHSGPPGRAGLQHLLR